MSPVSAPAVSANTSIKPTVKVLRVKLLPASGNLKALVDVELTGLFTFRGLRIVAKPNGAGCYVQWPSSQGKDGKQWFPSVLCHNQTIDEAVKAACLNAYAAQAVQP